MKKNILIDGFNLGLEKGTGVATYARNLSQQIGALGHDVSVLYGNPAARSRDPLINEISFFDSSPKGHPFLLQAYHALRGPRRRKAHEVPISGRVLSRQFESRLPHYNRIYNAPDVFARSTYAFWLWGQMSHAIFDETPDLAHWTYPLPIRIKGVPNIYTLHDLVPLRLPYTTLDDKRHYLRLIRKLARTADHVVTVSECSRQDLIEIGGMSPDRVTNTYQCAEIPRKLLEKSEEQVAREVAGAAGLDLKNYFLFWGSIEPKKNIGRMIEAYLASDAKAPLVIVGAQAWKSEQELRLLQSGHAASAKGAKGAKGAAGKRVILLPYAPFSLLVSLIRGAKAALFPSLYEGFGLPVLEAMQLGTPVICSNTSSLPEVAGDAALMIDPYDVGAISQAIRTLDSDEDHRSHLTQQGLAQAQLFSADRYRESLASVYAKFVGS